MRHNPVDSRKMDREGIAFSVGVRVVVFPPQWMPEIAVRRSTRVSLVLSTILVAAFTACSHNQASPNQASPNQISQEAQVPASDQVGNARIEMIAIKGGTFMMGASPGEPPHDEWLVKRLATPYVPHRVALSEFYMGKYLVTQALWRAVAGLPKQNVDLRADPSRDFTGDDLPVQNISWFEATEFCDRLSRATGHHYRLPTEAEWEYACRAGTTGVYAGDLDQMGWYAGNSGVAPLSNEALNAALKASGGTAYSDVVTGNKCQPHPVGRKQPNAWGLYDMHGNVSEWCQDWLADYPAADQQNPQGPSGPGVIGSKVIRGGDYFGTADRCTSANREEADPKAASTGVGFRVVREK